MTGTRLSVVAGLLLAAASIAGAQAPGGGESAGSRAGQRQPPARPLQGRGRAARGALQQPGAQANQQALARQVRQAFNVLVRRELDLDDAKARQLQTVERQYQQQRGQVQRDERAARLALKAAMEDTTSGRVDQAKVAQYMDQLVQAQHRRADLLEAEQKDLSSFLTPLQRAKYQALREQLNRRIQALRQDAAGRGAPPPQP